MCAENKRAWKIFPKMLLQAIVLALAAGTIAFCATKLLYKEEAIKIRAAVVVEEENQLTKFALDYVKSAEEGIEFIECDREEALEGLRKNEFSAVIILPEQLVEGILNGENSAVTVIYNDNLSAAGGFLKELTQAGADMLSNAQAEIYAIYELAAECSAESGLAEFQDTINYDNLGVALARSEFYQYKKVSATGNLSVKTYYIASAITAILLFFGMPMGMFLKQDEKAALMQYRRAGIGAGKQMCIRWLTVMGIYGAVIFMVSILGMIVWKKGFLESMSAAGMIWILAGSMAAFILLVYEVTEKKSSAVFLLASLTVVLLFFSGGILPKVFLPEIVRENTNWLPTVFWLEGIGEILEKDVALKAIGVSSLYGAGFWMAAAYLRCRRQRAW